LAADAIAHYAIRSAGNANKKQLKIDDAQQATEDLSRAQEKWPQMPSRRHGASGAACDQDN
jgi:hypothetical protein